MKVADFLADLARLPLRDLDAIAPGTSLVVAPHPDDESLGCGGFIAEAVRLGRPPVVVIASDGVGSHPNSCRWPADRLRDLREHEARDALSLLGLPPDRVIFLRLRDTAVPTTGPAFDAVVQTLAKLCETHDCINVLVPWRHDPHCDHEAVSLMGKALGAMCPALRVLAYPVWGLTLPQETLIDEKPPHGSRLDISTHLAVKRAAINAHRSQRGLVIDDDPEGFVLPEALLERLLRPYEYFIAS
ncbi:PIG-L family deacetylase [Acetobacter sicerae]|uniref:PIG-L family deacetylase n=1 Tax=Acetobacter sicerae TaxID=85325 RepID=A0ABS8VRF7_9PROT|nr:PIG-L deacetylase family protein [Acetobacter sicerae]MCE0743100.1 PIG-L family deacetylase [Acetobacter sicerae]